MNWFRRKPVKPRHLYLTVGGLIIQWQFDATDEDVEAVVRKAPVRKVIVGAIAEDNAERASERKADAEAADLSFLTWAAAAAELRVRYPEEGARFARVVQDLIAREQARTQK